MVEIQKAVGSFDAEVIGKLARKIMPEIYGPIIADIHIEYYLENFQSAPIIYTEIKDRSAYYFLLKFDSFPVGYMCIKSEENKLILDKL